MKVIFALVMLVFIPFFPTLVKSALTKLVSRTGLCGLGSLKGGNARVCKTKNGQKTIYINAIVACTDANMNDPFKLCLQKQTDQQCCSDVNMSKYPEYSYKKLY